MLASNVKNPSIHNAEYHLPTGTNKNVCSKGSFFHFIIASIRDQEMS